MNSVAEIITFINAALTSKYENGSITIQTMVVVIKQIGEMDFLTKIKKYIYKDVLSDRLRPCSVYILYYVSVPENCLEETTSTIYGQYIWPEAFPQVNQEMGCSEPKSGKAYRLW